MANDLITSCKRVGVHLTLAASAAFSLGGCATAPESSPTPNTAAPTTKCVEPSFKSAAAVLAVAALGHVLDAKTGGGRGFEMASGKLADELQHGCAVEKTPPPPAPTR